MEKDTGLTLSHLSADGGASRDGFLLQFQSDILNKPVRRPAIRETTALGAAYLAGLAVGYWESPEDIRHNWAVDKKFDAAMDSAKRTELLNGWHKAVKCALMWSE